MLVDEPLFVFLSFLYLLFNFFLSEDGDEGSLDVWNCVQWPELVDMTMGLCKALSTLCYFGLRGMMSRLLQ